MSPLKPFFILSAKILSFALFFVTLLAAYGGYFDTMRWTIPATALLFFPYLAILTLIVSACWFLARKYIIGAVGVGCLLLGGPTFFDALPLRFHESPTKGAVTFKMITYNCLHLRDSHPVSFPGSRPVDFLINSGADFICLQELYTVSNCEGGNATNAQLDSLKKIYPYSSTDGWRDMEFLSKYPFEMRNFDDVQQKYGFGSAAIFTLKIDGHELSVVNVHLPSYGLSRKERRIITELKDRGGVKGSVKEFEGSVYRKLHSAFASRGKVAAALASDLRDIKGPVIVCGDFNDVPGSWAYRQFTKEGFLDAYAKTGFGHLITYNQHLMYFHIDQILYRGPIKPLYVKKDRLNSSDHYPLIAEFEFLE